MKKLLLMFLISLILLPSLAFADGGMFPRDDFYVYETGQKGVILFENNVETLVLSTSFSGTAQDFSWIIPTPTQPEVTKVSKNIFTNLAELTQTTKNRNLPSRGLVSSGSAELAYDAVEVLEEKQIGYYDVTVLKSTDKNALYDWFSEHGYKYPEGGKYILDDYIRNEWIFTAVKINKEALTDTTLRDKLNYGDISPLKFEFASENIVYPMKITGIARFSEEILTPEKKTQEYFYFPNSMPITLYVFADHKKALTDFTVEYANWEEPKTINNLATDENGNSWVQVNKKMYLTKLQTVLDLEDMDEDLYLQNATNNNTFGVLSWWEKALEWMIEIIVFIIIILILMFFAPVYWQFKKTSKACRVISWISQIISFIFLGTLPLLYMGMIIFSMPMLGWDFEVIIIGLPYILMPLMMLVLLIAEGVWQKKNMQN